MVQANSQKVKSYAVLHIHKHLPYYSILSQSAMGAVGTPFTSFCYNIHKLE